MEQNLLIAITSAIAGGVITYFCSLLLNIQKSKNAIREKIIEKKMQCLDQLLCISKTMRLTVHNNNTDEYNTIVTYPKILSSRDEYDKFRVILTYFFNDHSHWMSAKLHKELYLLQDYFLNLDILIYKNRLTEDKLPLLGIIIKQDFKDFGDTIEREILNTYRSSYIRRIVFVKRNAAYKYDSNENRNKINKTMLKTYQKELSRLTEDE